MLLMIDNYDSFTYNLVQYFVELGVRVIVRRNDQVCLNELKHLSITHVVFSPGPGRPEDSGACVSVLEKYKSRLPILGVCLGHQLIAQYFGATVTHAKGVVHGKASRLHHNSKGIFKGLSEGFDVGRYHSLVVQSSSFPSDLEAVAWTQNEYGDKDEIMALQHMQYPIFGVQFHPESILSECGHDLLNNFLHE